MPRDFSAFITIRILPILLASLLIMPVCQAEEPGMEPQMGETAPAAQSDNAAPTESSDEVTVMVLKGTLSKTGNKELNLRDALEIAAGENPTLLAAKDAINESRAVYQTRLAELLPDLELTYVQSHFNGAIQPFGDTLLDVDRQSYNPQLLFRFPIFQGGRRLFAVRAAKRTLEAQQASAEQTVQETLRQTALNYYELKRQLDGIAIARKQLEETQAQLNINQARLEAGTGTRLDVLQSQAQVAQANQQLLEAVRLAETAAARLNELLALPAFVSVVPEEQGQQMQTLVPANTDYQKLVDLALEHRPELLAIDKQIASLAEIRKVAWSAALPEVVLQYRVGGIGPTIGGIENYHENAFGLDFTFRNLLVSALTRYKENSAQIQGLLHQREAVKNSIARQVAEFLLQALTQQAKVNSVRAELTASQQALDDAMERLNVGVGRNIDVLDAETRLTQSRTNMSRTILEFNQAQVNLVYALGLASVDSLTQGLQLP